MYNILKHLIHIVLKQNKTKTRILSRIQKLKKSALYAPFTITANIAEQMKKKRKFVKCLLRGKSHLTLLMNMITRYCLFVSF